MKDYKKEAQEFVSLLTKYPMEHKLDIERDYIFIWSLDTRTTLELLTVFRKFVDNEIEYDECEFSDNAIITIGLFREFILRDIIPDETWTYSFIPCNGLDIIFISYIIFGIRFGLLDAGFPVISDNKKLEDFISRILKSFMLRNKYEKLMGPFENRQKEDHICECKDCRMIRENY